VVQYKENEDGGLSVRVSSRFLIGFQITLLTALVSAIGYPILNSATVARHDPFTGTQGAKLEAKHDRLRKEFDEFVNDFEHYKVHHHDFALESVRKTENRITRLETKVKRIESK
jgi:hypothetical protein